METIVLRTIPEIRHLLSSELAPIPSGSTLDIYRDIALHPALGMPYLEQHLPAEEWERLLHQIAMEQFFRKRRYRESLLYSDEIQSMTSGRAMKARQEALKKEASLLGIPQEDIHSWLRDLHHYDIPENALSNVHIEGVVGADLYLSNMRVENSTLLGDFRNSGWLDSTFDNCRIGDFKEATLQRLEASNSTLSFDGEANIYDFFRFSHCTLDFNQDSSFYVFDVREDGGEKTISFHDCTIKGNLTISFYEEINREDFKIVLQRVKFEEDASILIRGYSVDMMYQIGGWQTAQLSADDSDYGTILRSVPEENNEN